MRRGYPQDLRKVARNSPTYVYKLNPDGTKGELVRIDYDKETPGDL